MCYQRLLTQRKINLTKCTSSYVFMAYGMDGKDITVWGGMNTVF